jgi:hypothetical protein
MLPWRKDKKPDEANTLENVRAILASTLRQRTLT